jgi:hypothetical protein
MVLQEEGDPCSCGLYCIPEHIVKNSQPPAYARVQPITKAFYIKNSVFHIPRRSDQLM